MSGPTDTQIEAAARAIDALWSDGGKRAYPFEQTENSYQDHCRSTAKAALATALSSQEAEIERLTAALKRLMLAYVNLLEIGRDRIVALGGQCDPVDVMEAGDPALRDAKAVLKDEG